jgi:hypothetical protein
VVLEERHDSRIKVAKERRPVDTRRVGAHERGRGGHGVAADRREYAVVGARDDVLFRNVTPKPGAATTAATASQSIRDANGVSETGASGPGRLVLLR